MRGEFILLAILFLKIIIKFELNISIDIIIYNINYFIRVLGWATVSKGMLLRVIQ